MESKKKAYANKKPLHQRPLGDFYETPYSLVWRLLDTGEVSGCPGVVDPCAGRGAIVDALDNDPRFKGKIVGFDLYSRMFIEKDIYDIEPDSFDIVVTNFPFTEWDAMVRKSLEIAPKVITIGRVNYFGTHDRNVTGFWNHLTNVYVFDRMIDYRTPSRTDGLFHVGALVTGWFVFERDVMGPPILEVIDVQEYAKLGAFKET